MPPTSSPSEALSWSDLEDLTVDHTGGIQGATNAQATLRLFGSEESAVRVTLYRDHHAWCPYCQKVWLLLEEKQVPYKIEKVPMRSYGDKPKWFLDKVPSGLLPVIELDGRMITESLVIMQLLDGSFPQVQRPIQLNSI